MGVLSLIKKIASPITDIVDKAVVDKDLKKQLKHEIEQSLLDQQNMIEKEISKRHALDMKSDSWLSKNIRPMTLAFLIFVFVVISFFDGNIGSFSVDESYIPVYQRLLSLVFTFYFGSRGFEKITKIYKDSEK